jgi:hypothetical protein
MMFVFESDARLMLGTGCVIEATAAFLAAERFFVFTLDGMGRGYNVIVSEVDF